MGLEPPRAGPRSSPALTLNLILEQLANPHTVTVSWGYVYPRGAGSRKTKRQKQGKHLNQCTHWAKFLLNTILWAASRTAKCVAKYFTLGCPGKAHKLFQIITSSGGHWGTELFPTGHGQSRAHTAWMACVCSARSGCQGPGCKPGTCFQFTRLNAFSPHTPLIFKTAKTW